MIWFFPQGELCYAVLSGRQKLQKIFTEDWFHGNSPGWIQPEYRDRTYDDDENETPIWSKTLLKKVKSYIYNNLGLAKVNIIDPRKGDFVQPLKVTELLTELQIADDDFYSGLSISKDDDFELHI